MKSPVSGARRRPQRGDPRAGPRADGCPRRLPRARARARARGASATTFSVADLYLYMLVGLGELHRRAATSSAASACASTTGAWASGRRSCARASWTISTSGCSATTRSCAPAGRSERGAIVAAWRLQTCDRASARAARAGRARARRRAGARRACPGARFVSIGLHEPPKADYLAWLAGGARPASLRARRSSSIASAACTSSCATSTPSAVVSQRGRARRALADHARGLRGRRRGRAGRCRAGARRCAGAGSRTSRSCRSTCSPRAGSGSKWSGDGASRAPSRTCATQPGDNGYAHPIESLIAYVDLDECRVLELEELDVKPIPGGRRRLRRRHGRRSATTCGRSRSRSRRASASRSRATRSAGTAGRCARRSIRRRASCCTTCASTAGPVLHRASCAEMIVPYGEPHPMHSWRTYFDAGEYGLGGMHELARAGLRLRRRDPLPRRASRRPRRAPARARRTRSACTRRTPACSGSTATSSPGASRCGGRGASCSTRW